MVSPVSVPSTASRNRLWISDYPAYGCCHGVRYDLRNKVVASGSPAHICRFASYVRGRPSCMDRLASMQLAEDMWPGAFPDTCRSLTSFSASTKRMLSTSHIAITSTSRTWISRKRSLFPYQPAPINPTRCTRDACWEASPFLRKADKVNAAPVPCMNILRFS